MSQVFQPDADSSASASNRTLILPGRGLLALLALLALLSSGKVQADKGDGRIDPEVLKTVKKATVYLRVTLPDGDVVQGSGFFAAVPNLVLTNAHVLGMLRSESRKPTKIEVVLNSGEKDERTVLGRVLAVDSGSDIAALVVTAKNLPEPLRISKVVPNETDPVFIFGFPFGKELGKNVTVSKSSVSSLRKDKGGVVVEKIQVNGGMHPGNSGGPVIDDKGQVLGVSVSGIRSTTINFAIPSRSVHYFLIGKRKSWWTGAAYTDGELVKVPVRVEMIDPLKSVKEVWYETWTGDPGKPRSAVEVKPEQQPGDSVRIKHVLTYKDGVAEGELSFPATPAKGKVWWYQFMYTANKSTNYMSGNTYATLPPVERKAYLLKHRPQLGVQSQWKLSSTTTLKLRDEEDVDHPLTFKMTAEMNANTAKEVKSGTATATAKLSKMELIYTVDEKPVAESKDDPDIAKEALLVTVLVDEKVDGRLGQTTADLKRIPRATQKQWTTFTNRIFTSLEAVYIPLPGQELAAGKSWKATLPLTVFSPGSSEVAVADVTYEYVGIRTRNKREEAVVLFTGTVKGSAGEGTNVGGKLKGETWIDIITGQVVLSRNTVDVDLDTLLGKKRARASGTLEVILQRTVPKE